jgi:hypothetical protein
VANDRRERIPVRREDLHAFAKQLNYYATVPAPPTIGELARALDERDVGCRS